MARRLALISAAGDVGSVCEVADDSRPLVAPAAGSWLPVGEAEFVEPEFGLDETYGPVRFAPPATFGRDDDGARTPLPVIGDLRWSPADRQIWHSDVDLNPYEPGSPEWSRPGSPPGPNRGGVSQWEPRFDYLAGDRVEAHDKLWEALSGHRSKQNDSDDQLGELKSSLWLLVV